MYNKALKDPNLSARAKGVWAFLMSLPEEWKINASELQRHFRDKRDAIRSAMSELEKYGYVVSGLILTKEYDVYKKKGPHGWDPSGIECRTLLKMTTDKKNMTTSYKTPKIKESKNALLLHFFSQFHPRRSFETKLVLPSTKNLFTHSLVENLSSLSHRGIV